MNTLPRFENHPQPSPAFSAACTHLFSGPSRIFPHSKRLARTLIKTPGVYPPRANPRRNYPSTIASASISTSISAEISLEISTMLVAGRIARKKFAVRPPHLFPIPNVRHENPCPHYVLQLRPPSPAPPRCSGSFALSAHTHRRRRRSSRPARSRSFPTRSPNSQSSPPANTPRSVPTASHSKCSAATQASPSPPSRLASAC